MFGHSVVGRLGLADTGDVVLLALDRHQRDAPDLREVDGLVAMHQLALGQAVLHEDLVDRLKIELRREVHDGKIFVIEFAVLLGRIAVALHEMLEHLAVSLEMPVDVHGHEAGQLQEARIDRPQESRVRKRHVDDACWRNHSIPRFSASSFDLRRTDAGVDRAAHERHRARRARIVLGFHARDAAITGTEAGTPP